MERGVAGVLPWKRKGMREVDWYGLERRELGRKRGERGEKLRGTERKRRKAYLFVWRGRSRERESNRDGWEAPI